MRNVVSALLALGMISSSAVVALAASERSNRDAAQAMVSVIKSAPGTASVASTLSGNKNPVAPSYSGWGNIGSDFFGDQVSRGKK